MSRYPFLPGHADWAHTANEGPVRIQYTCLVPVYVFPKIKLLFPKQNYNVLSPSSYTLISVSDLYIFARKGIHKGDIPCIPTTGKKGGGPSLLIVVPWTPSSSPGSELINQCYRRHYLRKYKYFSHKSVWTTVFVHVTQLP